MQNRRIELKWALIFTAVSLLWMLLEKSLGWHDRLIEKHAIYTNLFAVVAIGLYVFALLDVRRTTYGGYLTWKQGFVSGLIISVGVALLSPLAQYVTHKVITPDYFANARTYAVSNGLLDAESAEQYFSLSNYLWQAAAGALVLGIVTAALVALVVRRRAA